MTQAERQAWLAAAAQKLQGMAITVDVLRDALRVITVDHPAKIIPAIRAHLGDWSNPVYVAPAIQPRVAIEAPARPITLAEIRAMPGYFRDMGLGKGWITQEQINEIGDA